MGYTVTNKGGAANIPVQEIFCDTSADLKDVPEVPAGSTAYIIDAAEVYIMNTKGDWIKQ